jgi:general secretion pathway protein I
VAGFTLVEALVALAIVSVCLSSIGALIATTVRGTRSIDAKLTTLHVGRSVLSALPDRDKIVLGTISGRVARHTWRLEISPISMSHANPKQLPPWIAQRVVVTVESAAGVPLQISGIRLRRRDGG